MSAPAVDAAGAVNALRSTAAIRERAAALLARARAGESTHFTVDDAALASAARTVAELTRQRFPDLRIPYHSRWRHFEAGQVNRVARLDALLGPVDPAERARTQIDLALVSVLLDAGAGAEWGYREADSKQTFSRSEGLGVASFHAFTAGLFSSDPAQPLRVDAAGLAHLTAERLGEAFQVSERNPLVGLEGRTAVLRRLGLAMREHVDTYGPLCRPGALFDALHSGPTIEAHAILSALLGTLSSIWPAQNAIGDIALGDCWPHPAVQGEGFTAGWMPFHKLSQWLTYSLLEPFEWAGVRVQGLDALTGLPEYRNGGLLIDAGVLHPLPTDHATRTWQAGDTFIVEWRALTVALLDELAPLVRAELKLDAVQMPLACVLEGGTWAAGRLLALRLRGGLPPLNIASDGTVF
ncbi:URC4/urg3 family protein [Hydrogenophaga sp.]|uniref:URC4/urg3 family protein n=1 Tax=Hydrogenophaga sp. TaxID=1904254 RepID=UPI00272F4827|nr:URC4/urg3 family protein [Hydrogenophaga sp.]MDP2017639.1 URC4/urg3 family protein [Hydrogenophaga sp.]MDP3164215.1 URC4/urg3 family protein [Hydrogenophaga sp.]MDP3811400.1 URC4/urg3 family protein [Hydrogenophaga sp.]